MLHATSSSAFRTVVARVTWLPTAWRAMYAWPIAQHIIDTLYDSSFTKLNGIPYDVAINICQALSGGVHISERRRVRGAVDQQRERRRGGVQVAQGRGLHSSTSQLNLSRSGQ